MTHRDLTAILATWGTDLRARQAADRARLDAEREEREQAMREWQAQRDAEWSAESKRLERTAAPVLAWPERSTK